MDGKRAWSEPLGSEAKAAGFLGWHQRGYLPHHDVPGVTQLVTFRLQDALPACRRSEWEALLHLENDRERRKRLEEYLDRGLGECWLRLPAIAAFAEDALRFFDGERYRLEAWVLMPNHAHVVVQVWQTPLSRLAHSWKGFIARAANKRLRREGTFWEREYWETLIRDDAHRSQAVRYVEANPVKAGLVREAKEWRWSSARCRDESGRLPLPPVSAGRSAGLPPAYGGQPTQGNEQSTRGDDRTRKAGWETGAPGRHASGRVETSKAIGDFMKRTLQNQLRGLGFLVCALWATSAAWAATSSADSNIIAVDTRAVPTGTLTGLVEGGGAPVANAQVRIDGTAFAASTGADGTFTLANVPVGSGYLLKVSAAQYASKQVSGITVTSGTKDLGTIQLVALAGPYRLVPLQPDVNPAVTQIGESGVAYRYYRTVTADGKTPAGGVPVLVRIAGGSSISQDSDVSDFWPGRTAGVSDADGTVRVRLGAADVGGPGSSASLEVLASGVVQQTFTAKVVLQTCDWIWRHQLGGGVSVGEMLTAGADTGAKSTICRTVSGGQVVGETIYRQSTVDSHVGPGASVGFSLSVSTPKFNFVAGAEASAEQNVFLAIGLDSEYVFYPDTENEGENAMKLYVDLGNVLSGVPGPKQTFYKFVDATIAPSFLAGHLVSLEGDVQMGADAEGQVDFGSGFLGPISVGFQAEASANEQAIFGKAFWLGSPQESATVTGVAASGTAMVSGRAALGVADLPGLRLAAGGFDWGKTVSAQMIRRDWTRAGESSTYRTEVTSQFGLGSGQQNQMRAWRRYDPEPLYDNYARNFIEQVEQSIGSNTATYDWAVEAEEQQLGINLSLGSGLGVTLTDESYRGAEIVNERGTISQSRYWPTECYPALTADRLPTESWSSILLKWAKYASGPIGRAVNWIASTVVAGVDTVIQAGTGAVHAVVQFGQGVMAEGSQIITQVIPSNSGATPGPQGGRSHPVRPMGGPTNTANLVYGIGGIYRFQSTNSFNGTGTLTITYAPTEIVGFDAADLRIYRLPDGTNRWQLVGGTVDVASNMVTATISQLGTYAAAPPMPTGDLLLVPSTNTLAADGVSQITITVTNILLNTRSIATQQWAFTATAAGATILNADADPSTPGVQVFSTNGSVTLVLQAPMGGNLARVSLASVAGDASGTVAINLADNTPPAMPVGVTTTAGQSRVWVSWQTNSEPDLASYRVYYRSGQAGPPWDGTATVEGTASPVTVAGTNCLLRGLMLGTNYFVAVSAVDTTGNESPLSVPEQATTTPTAPAPPTAVAASFGTDGTNILMWALSEDDGYNDRDVLRYDVLRAVLPGGNYVKVGEVAAGIGLFSETNTVVVPPSYLSYAVLAVATNGLSSLAAASDRLMVGSNQIDTDGDGIPDWWTLQYFGHPTGQASDQSLAQGDPTGDGLTNLQKFQWGLNPLAPTLLTLDPVGITANGNFAFNIGNSYGRGIVVQGSTNLVDWPVLATLSGATNVIYFEDAQSTNAAVRFYRAVIP